MDIQINHISGDSRSSFAYLERSDADRNTDIEGLSPSSCGWTPPFFQSVGPLRTLSLITSKVWCRSMIVSRLRRPRTDHSLLSLMPWPSKGSRWASSVARLGRYLLDVVWYLTKVLRYTHEPSLFPPANKKQHHHHHHKREEQGPRRCCSLRYMDVIFQVREMHVRERPVRHS